MCSSSRLLKLGSTLLRSASRSSHCRALPPSLFPAPPKPPLPRPRPITSAAAAMAPPTAVAPSPQNYWGDMPEAEFYAANGVRNSKAFFKTPEGTLFTQEFAPVKAAAAAAGGKPKAVVCLIHGYTSDTGWLFQSLAIEIAKWGLTAAAADMLGHGRSDGIHGYVPSVDKVAAALLAYYQSVRDRDENKGVPCFVLGESMGAMVAYFMHFRDPKGWDGFIFSAPLFRMPGPMRPTRLQLAGFGLVKPLVSSWPIFPENHIVRKAIRDPAKQKVIAGNPRRYKGRPRVGTMLELTRAVDHVGSNMHEFRAPFLVMHGTADAVTDPEGSKALHKRAASHDRTLKLYDGAYHSLIQGELDETRDQVLADIKAWLDERVQRKTGA